MWGVGAAPERAERVRPHLAVHHQAVVSLEPAHATPRSAVRERVRPDVEQSLDTSHGRCLLSKTEDAVMPAAVVAMAASVGREQRPPCVRPNLSVRQQVMVALEALDGALGVGAEDAIVRHAHQTLRPDHQPAGAARPQDGARDRLPVRSVRGRRRNQRRGGKADARERAQRPSELTAVKVTHGDPAPVLGRVY
jgi:hypothetical protein